MDGVPPWSASEQSCIPQLTTMTRVNTLFKLCTLALGAVNAFPAPDAYSLHEKRELAPQQWEKRDRVRPDIVVPVRIGLTQSNLDRGPFMLDEVSNPSSPKYGQHYSVEEVNDIFAPSQESVDAVQAWLHRSIHPDRITQSVNKQWLQVDASIGEVEALVGTEYYHYEHLSTGKSNIACDEYSLPDHVIPHVDYITPGLKLLTPSFNRHEDPKDLEKRIFGVTAHGKKPILPPVKKPLPMALPVLLDLALDAICQKAIIPECIATMYNITKPTKANPDNKLGIFEDLNDKYSQTDLNEFFAVLAQNIPIGTHPVLESIDGATAPVAVNSAGVESDLDFQISYPVIYPQNSILFQTDDDVYETSYTYEGFLNNFLDAIDGSYCRYSAYGEFERRLEAF